MVKSVTAQRKAIEATKGKNMIPEHRPITTNDNLQMLTASDVAERLRISVRGVWRQVSTGRMPAPIYVGRLARWPQATIKDWMEQGCPSSDEMD